MSEAPLLLQKLGWKVPEDIAVASTSVLDGNADAGIFQNSDNIGRAAVEMLIGLINCNQAGFPKLCQEALVATQISQGPAQEEAAICVLHQWALQDINAAQTWAMNFPEDPLRNRAMNELSIIEHMQSGL